MNIIEAIKQYRCVKTEATQLQQLIITGGEIESFKKQLVKCNTIVTKVNNYVMRIDDSFVRLIILHKYINGTRTLSWQAVAHKINGGNKADSIRKRCNRYLKKHNEQVNTSL